MSAVIVVFFAVILIGGPIAVALGLAGVAGLVDRDLKLLTVPARMFTAIDSFVLLAAPFFILAGDLMNRGGITDRLIRLSQLIAGRIRGATAYANIIASIFFAGISGTAIADTAALGQVFIKGMPKEGYTKEFSAAVTVASSMIGPIIPPSVIMVIYGAVTQISVIQLFMAGILPGLMLGAACAVVVFIYGLRGGLPEPIVSFAPGERRRVARDGAIVASLPALIVLGTISGAFTATEAGGIAVIYAAFIGAFVFRHLDLQGTWKALEATARTTATLYLVVACAGIASYVLTITGAAAGVRHLGAYFVGQPELFLLTLMVLLLFLGCFLDPGVQVLVFVPLLLPVSRAMGIPDLQFSMVVLLTGTLGLITPPVGICLFVACRIGDLRIGQLFRAVLPFLLAETLAVALLCLVPGFSTWLPSLVR